MAKYRIILSVGTLGMTSKQLNSTVETLILDDWEKVDGLMETWQTNMEAANKTEVHHKVMRAIARVKLYGEITHKLAFAFQISRQRPIVGIMS